MQVTAGCLLKFDVLFDMITVHGAAGWPGAVLFFSLASCPRLIASCLDLAITTRGMVLETFTCSLSADAPRLIWQEKRVRYC